MARRRPELPIGEIQLSFGKMPGGGGIIACLAKSNDKLTAECKKVLGCRRVPADAQKSRLPQIKEPRF
jgi:hypothetical protein